MNRFIQSDFWKNNETPKVDMLKWIKNNSIKYWGIVDQILIIWVNRQANFHYKDL